MNLFSNFWPKNTECNAINHNLCFARLHMLKLNQSPEPLQPCAINHTYALQDFTGKTSQLPKPLQCQRPVCNYGYYCSRSNRHHQSSLCRDKFLVDERVFVVERTPGRRSVRLQHALDPSEFRQICLWFADKKAGWMTEN